MWKSIPEIRDCTCFTPIQEHFFINELQCKQSGKFFKQINLYTVLIQEISAFFIDQSPSSHVFRQVHSMVASEFSAVYNLTSYLVGKKTHNVQQD